MQKTLFIRIFWSPNYHRESSSASLRMLALGLNLKRLHAPYIVHLVGIEILTPAGQQCIISLKMVIWDSSTFILEKQSLLDSRS